MNLEITEKNENEITERLLHFLEHHRRIITGVNLNDDSLPVNYGHIYFRIFGAQRNRPTLSIGSVNYYRIGLFLDNIGPNIVSFLIKAKATDENKYSIKIDLVINPIIVYGYPVSTVSDILKIANTAITNLLEIDGKEIWVKSNGRFNNYKITVDINPRATIKYLKEGGESGKKRNVEANKKANGGDKKISRRPRGLSRREYEPNFTSVPFRARGYRL